MIIPTFNRWPHICAAIDSVLGQTYDKTDCLVVDDHSSDDTLDLLKDKYGDKISVLFGDANRGQSYCKNLGAKSCDSDYICFLDSDDILEADAVEQRVTLLTELTNAAPDQDAAKKVIASFGLIRHNNKARHSLTNKKSRGDKLFFKEYLAKHGWCHNNGFLINREVFLRHGMYDERLRNKEDIELLLRLLAKHPFHYCGAEIGDVRDVCNDRARNNYDRIIKQNTLFSSIVQNNELLASLLDNEAIRRLVWSDVEEELRSLYKLKNYIQFQSFYKKVRKDSHFKNKRRFFKRYLISYLKQIL